MRGRGGDGMMSRGRGDWRGRGVPWRGGPSNRGGPNNLIRPMSNHGKPPVCVRFLGYLISGMMESSDASTVDMDME